MTAQARKSIAKMIRESADRIKVQNPDAAEIISQYRIAYNRYRELVIEGDNHWHDLRKYYILKEAYLLLAKERGIVIPE